MSKIYAQDPLIEEVLYDLEVRFPGQIVSVFSLLLISIEGDHNNRTIY
ncbi:MAG: hypothetical protein ACFE9R_21285 [Candidatus Hermodarchaeota archaeon]